MIKFLKNQLNKRYKKQLELTRVNPLSIILMNKLWNLILNQINVKWWNWKKTKSESTGLTR